MIRAAPRHGGKADNAGNLVLGPYSKAGARIAVKPTASNRQDNVLFGLEVTGATCSRPPMIISHARVGSRKNAAEGRV